MSHNLPPELWIEIFIRLQVRTLLTLKCVSKSFLSIIENPNFASLHTSRHKNYSNVPQNSSLLLLEFPTELDSDSNWQFVARNSDTLIKTMQFSALIYCDCAFEVEGYVNGLLLIRKYESNEIILWNPSIRKHRIIPSPPICQLKFVDLGFGYDPLSNDYKVVAIVQSDAQSCRVVEVYELSSGNWRTVRVDGLSNGWYLFHKVYFNGAIHWLAEFDDPGGYNITHVISFDLGTEMISYNELPVDEDGYCFRRRCKFPLVFNGLFAVFYISSKKSCLWVMEDSSWVELYAGESSLEDYQFINQEFQVISNLVQYKDHELLFNPGSGLESYNLESRELNTCHHHHHDGDCATYVGILEESLAWSGLFPH